MPLRDAEALAAGILAVLEDNLHKNRQIPVEYLPQFQQGQVALRYLEEFERLINE